MAKGTLQVMVTGAGGRMGSQLVRQILEDPGLELVGATETEAGLKSISHLPCAVSTSLKDLFSVFPRAVAIDFTSANASLENARVAAAQKGAIVIGSTGFTGAERDQLAEYAREAKIFWSANMSVGVAALLEILPKLAELLGPAYDLEIMELHHKRKKDAPSGTALMLAEALAKSRGWKLDEVRKAGRNGLEGERPRREIGVHALRGGDVVGIHSIWFLGPGETLEITHQAQSRENFASGALRAAAWLAEAKPGKLYSMRDML